MMVKIQFSRKSNVLSVAASGVAFKRPLMLLDVLVTVFGVGKPMGEMVAPGT